MSHKVQINGSPQSVALLEWQTRLSDWEAASSQFLGHFQQPKGKDGEKTGRQVGKQNFFLIFETCSTNESMLVIISLIIQAGQYTFSLF